MTASWLTTTWTSPDRLSHVITVLNWGIVCTLILGGIFTALTIVASNRRDALLKKLDTEREQASTERTAQLENGIKRAQKQAEREQKERHPAPQILREVPRGEMNGINKNFTLSHVPNPPSSLDLWLNGVEQTGLYTLNGRVITLKVAPDNVDQISARYTYKK